MKNLKLEKRIIKIDRDIEALNIAKKYLSNGEEIESVKVELNRERQLLIYDLYGGDRQAHAECLELITPMIGQELLQGAQLTLLDEIKEIFGRRFPDVSKSSNGLNAWLTELNASCDWTQNEGSDWATLIITSITPKKFK
ncbi:MAG: hypothetical protein ACRCTE_07795 [Cellulosilyticaceae bacterium]